jgi:hypothetical protein
MKLVLEKVAAAVDACVSVLAMRDWTLHVVLCSAEQMNEVMPGVGALAICSPVPERHIATVHVLADFPEHEDLMSTLMHELTHAKLSPLTALLEFTPAAVMLEEGIVESLGNALASTVPAYARAIRRALAAPRARSTAVRARISALAPRQRERGRIRMDPEMIKKALEALLSGDAEACKAILQELITAAAAGGGAPSSEELPREEQPGDVPQPAREEQPPMGRSRGRQAPAVSPHEARARRAADSLNRDAIRARIHTSRVVDGFSLPAELETEILRCSDIDDAERLLRVARLARGEGQSRARNGGEQPNTLAPAADTAAPETAEKLAAEGFDRQFVRDYQTQHKADPAAAAAMLAGGRVARARKANGAGRPGAQ